MALPHREIEPGLQPLFIADSEKGIGIITHAEKRYAKGNGHPYIWVTVDCGGADQVSCVMTRSAYTWAVLNAGWGRTQADEEENISNLIGMEAQIKWKHTTVLDNVKLCHLHIRSIGRKRS